MQDFSIPDGVTAEQFDRRKSAREIVEKHMRRMEADPDKLNTMDDFNRSAYSLLTSEKARHAFSLDGETDAVRDLYGRNYKLKQNAPAAVGERLLLGRRLVEAGVRFVTVNYGAWDAHVGIKDTCTEQMPALDHAIAGLITDLDQRGLLDSTLVMVTTEFGRTPKINKDNGRDHWARVYSMLMAGGGITRGQVYGASDATAAEPARDEVKVEDFLSTVYHQLGIDSNEKLVAFGGTRPIDIIKNGKVVERHHRSDQLDHAFLFLSPVSWPGPWPCRRQSLILAAHAGPMVHHIEVGNTPRAGQRGTTVEVTLEVVPTSRRAREVLFLPAWHPLSSEIKALPSLTERRACTMHSGYIEDRVRCRSRDRAGLPRWACIPSRCAPDHGVDDAVHLCGHALSRSWMRRRLRAGQRSMARWRPRSP